MSLRARAAAALGRQLACPSGAGGRLLGPLMRFANRRPSRALIDALAIRPHHRVLDIGCGDGAVLAMLGDVAWRAGVDRSATMIAAARHRLAWPIRTGRADIVEGDMRALPFADGSFDRIIASNVLYFCDNIPAFLAECRRVGRPGATLGIYVTAAQSMARWAFASQATHRHFERGDLEQIFAANALGADDFSISPLSLPGGIEGLIATVELRPAT